MGALPLAIVTVNYRGWDDLQRCLDSVSVSADGSPTEREIIVVDNDSGDGRLTEFQSRYPTVQFINNPGNPGFAHACNVGFHASRAPLVLFLNPDCLDPGGEVDRLVAKMGEHPEADVLAPRQLDARGRPQKVFDRYPACRLVLGPVRGLLRRLLPRAFGDPRRCRDPWKPVDWVSGSALLARREALEHVSGWCEDYWMYSEDVDLCRRLTRCGKGIFFTADVTLEHRHGGSSRSSPESAARTRAEVIMSRHLYAHRHMRGIRRSLYHGLLVLGRVVPMAIAAGVATLVPLNHPWLVERRLCFRHLQAYYHHVRESGLWLSRRSVHFPA